jgi:hypothetical protein
MNETAAWSSYIVHLMICEGVCSLMNLPQPLALCCGMYVKHKICLAEGIYAGV